MPDGQVAFRSSGRVRKSGRRHRPREISTYVHHHHDRHRSSDEDGGGGGGDSGAEPTMDIQIPGIGRLQVPLEQGGTQPQGHAAASGVNHHQRHQSERRGGAMRRMTTFARRRTVSQSTMDEQRSGAGTVSPRPVDAGGGGGLVSPRIVVSPADNGPAANGRMDFAASPTGDKPRRQKFSTVEVRVTFLSGRA